MIKLFEEYNHLGYQKISAIDLFDFIHQKKPMDNINDREFNAIKNLFNYKSVEVVDKWWMENNFRIKVVINPVRRGNITYEPYWYIAIDKYEDEWYHVYYDGGRDIFVKYYRCDQFDGLMNCLRDIKEADFNILIKESNEYSNVIEKITPNEYRHSVLNLGKEEFSVSEIKLIEKIFPQISSYNGTFSIKINTGNFNSIYIHKFEDEWFYVGIEDYLPYKYYRCDQFDSLLKLLKDHKENGVERIGSKEYWEFISRYDRTGEKSLSQPGEFTKQELSELRNILPLRKVGNRLEGIRLHGSTSITIYKIEDGYIVSDLSGHEWDYYRCPHFDSLVEFLKNF